MFFKIEDWMITEFHLKSNDLLVFAYLHSFDFYYGGIEQIAEVLGLSRRTVCTSLAKLEEKKLISKSHKKVNGKSYVNYETTRRKKTETNREVKKETVQNDTGTSNTKLQKLCTFWSSTTGKLATVQNFKSVTKQLELWTEAQLTVACANYKKWIDSPECDVRYKYSTVDSFVSKGIDRFQTDITASTSTPVKKTERNGLTTGCETSFSFGA